MLIVNSFNILKKKGKENKTQQYFGLYKFCIWVDVTVRDLSLQGVTGECSSGPAAWPVPQ